MENTLTQFSALEHNHLDFIESLNLSDSHQINKCADKLIQMFQQEEYGLAFKVLNKIDQLSNK